MTQPYLEGLNENQRIAVECTQGPLMIVAGAGSGKTKVLTTRIAHLMNQGVDAFNIMALTFTNKAAAEMKERVEKTLGGNTYSRNLFIGTFHSIFARIMRVEADKLGYPRNFTIYDTDDAKGLIRSIVKEMGLDDKLYKPNFIYNRISAAKNALIGPLAYRDDSFITQEDTRNNRPRTGEIFQIYVDKCFKNGAFDFDDLLYKMYELLTRFPEVLAKYQHRFHYIMIDEYQDTNVAQYKVMKLLAAVHENICVVGDDAQSIYSFRGATVQNILQFKDDYDDVKVVKLEQNYRSTQSILAVANKVIGNNKDQIPKNLWTENLEGEKIKVVRTLTDNDEGRYIADAIMEMKLRNHYANNDFVVLYRTNAQSRSFEEALRRMNVPYRLVGGTSFYQRKEVKDFLAYLRIVVNPQDEENLKRIINYPTRGIGKTSIERIMVQAAGHNKSFWDTIQHPQLHGIAGSGGIKIEAFATMIKSFQTLLDKGNAYEMAFAVGKHTGLVADLYNDKSVEGLARYENVQELLNAIKEFTETPDEEGEIADKSLGSYLQQITLLTDADQDDPNSNDAVKLMTIHAAKGLEFACVFSVGLEENLFPSNMSMYDKKDLEEERRLFYVAVTRAKERLWITYANTRYRFGNLVQNDPSRFLQEVPEEFMDKSFTGMATSSKSGKLFGGSNFDKPPDTHPSGLKSLADNAMRGRAMPHTPSADFAPSAANTMEIGMKVEHQKFGFGKILAMEGGPQNKIATIDFGGGHGEKKIMLNYAKLKIVEH